MSENIKWTNPKVIIGNIEETVNEIIAMVKERQDFYRQPYKL